MNLIDVDSATVDAVLAAFKEEDYQSSIGFYITSSTVSALAKIDFEGETYLVQTTQGHEPAVYLIVKDEDEPDQFEENEDLIWLVRPKLKTKLKN